MVNWLYLKILKEFNDDLEAISVSIKAIEVAKANKVLVSFDPNILTC
ncbi:hypothetical protein KTC97_12180 [Clostridium estertheticum]|nr:hypothetical protein [Clostridium estertheticum]WLC86340.1 hypothetical protein KTC97_12180 [Clostridium estertheticum]